MYIKINEATNYIKTQYHGKIDLAIILGSGLGPLADEIENPIELDYRDIPHFPISNLIGHAGKLIIGTLENKTVIAGHNHKPMLNPNGTPMYFNDGSCVHPRCITGLEIADGSIQLVKWSVKARDTGELIIDRDVLSGPVKIKEAAENTLFSTT